MSTFTEKEIEYLRGQPLGRLATVGRDGSPHVVPVGFRPEPRGRCDRDRRAWVQRLEEVARYGG